jgi:hypothetical protein
MRTIKCLFFRNRASNVCLGVLLALQLCAPASAGPQWVAQEIDQTPMSSRPSAIQYSTGPTNTWDIVFFEGPSQSMYAYLWLAPAKALANIATTCGPGAVLANKTLAIFYCGTNGHIWVASETLNFDSPSFDKLDIVDTGFGGITSDPSAASMDGKAIDVVYRGANGHLWQMHVSDVQHKKWSAPEDLNAPIPSSPSLKVLALDSSQKTFGLQVLYVGADGHLWGAYWPTDVKKRLWWSGGVEMGTDLLGSNPTVDIQLGTVYYVLAPSRASGIAAAVPAIADRLYVTDDIQERDSSYIINTPLAPAQTQTVANANFSTLIGNAVSTTLYYRNSVGHLSMVSYPQTIVVPNCGQCPPGQTCSCPPPN